MRQNEAELRQSVLSSFINFRRIIQCTDSRNGAVSPVVVNKCKIIVSLVEETFILELVNCLSSHDFTGLTVTITQNNCYHKNSLGNERLLIV